MKKTLWIVAGLLALATLAWVQVNQPGPPPLASLMPAGPMIYLEAKDFHAVLDEWNQSGVKRAWLASANYRVFSNSNLLQKLQGLYQEYGAVAGFLPGVPGTLEIAGSQSALGLYDLREQQFVYITRLDESQFVKSQLWRLRDRFTTRQASGIQFYLRRDDATNRTVAFALTNGWLILATRDDLIAGTLALIAGKPASSLASEAWYSGALARAGNPGELRMALNIQALISDVRFRSYWIQRNVSELRPFEAELVDVQRTRQDIAETRVLVRAAERQIAQPITLPSASALTTVAALRSLAPPDAALTRAWAAPSPDLVESLIETRLLNPSAEATPGSDYAPAAVSTDDSAGSEQDLETRIDEPRLANAVTGALKSAAIRELISRGAPDALLQIESTTRASGFVRTPSVLVVSAPASWDAAALREGLSSAVETLWSTSRLGVEWRQIAMGGHSAQELNGLATLLFAIDGNRLYLANDSALLLATLNRAATPPVQSGPAYAAEFHHARERADYMTIMQALDFGGRQQPFLFTPQGNRTPQFFSDNLASLSSVFNFIQSMIVTRVESQGVETQRVVYR
jgi:hypothetical protein